MLKIRHKSVLFAIVIFVVGIFANVVRCTDPRTEQVDRLNAQFVVLWEQSRSAETIPLAEKTLEISKETLGLNDSMTGIVMSNLGKIYNDVERPDWARPLLEQALHIQEQAVGPDHVYVAEVLDNLGNAYRGESNFDSAAQTYRRALLIREKLTDDQNIAKALYNLAGCYTEMGDWKEGEQYLRKSIALFEKLGGSNPATQVTILLNRGFIHQVNGRYDQALSLYEQALDLSGKTFGPDHPVTASTINALAISYASVNQPQLALPLALQVVELMERRNVGYRYKAGAYSSLSAIYLSLGRSNEARESSEKAVQIAEKEAGDQHPSTAHSLLQLGAYYQDQALYHEAESRVRRAVEILKARYGPVHPETARAQAYLGGALVGLNRFGEALDALSLSFTTSLASDTPADVRRTGALALAHYYDKRGNAAPAIFFYKLALDIFEQMRQGSIVLPQELRRPFTGEMEDRYRRLVNLLRDEGRDSEAEDVLTLLKEHEGLAFFGGGPDSNQKLRAMELSRFEKGLQANFKDTAEKLKPLYHEYTRLYAKKSRGVLSGVEVKNLENTEEDLRAVQNNQFSLFEELEQKGVHSNAQEFQVSPENLADLPSLLQKLGDQTSTKPAIVHFLPEKDSTAFIVTMPHPLASKHLKGGKRYEDLKRLIAEFRAAIEKKDQSYRASACQLYKALIAPIEPILRDGNIDTLMLDLSGPLRYIPFSALYDIDRCPKRAAPGQVTSSITCPSKKCPYLIEKYSIALYTSPTEKQLEIQPAEKWSAFALGRSKGTSKYRPLQFVPQELSRVVRGPDDIPPLGVMTGHRYLDDDFTLTSMLAIMEGDLSKLGLTKTHNVLHISTHFDLAPASPYHSKLVLNENESLDLLQIKANQQINLGSYDLVTLAACQTGISDTANGVEIESLGATLQHKGAKSVLATLWSVQDQGTAAFVEEFYRNRGEIRQTTKAAALQKSQLEFIQGRVKVDNHTADLRHPYYWSGFILMGNWL